MADSQNQPPNKPLLNPGESATSKSGVSPTGDQPPAAAAAAPAPPAKATPAKSPAAPAATEKAGATVNLGSPESTPGVTASATAPESAVKPATARELLIYDFKRPERVSKEHIRALASIHDGFARNFGATLSGFLRTIIDTRVVGVEQLTYGEFVHSLPNPTCFIVLSAPPLEGQMCLELSPLIVYPIIDRLLGGNHSEIFIPTRPLTAIEWRLMNRLIERALEHLAEAWRNLIELKFEVVESESNPQLVHIVAPTEVVVFITFEIRMGQSTGTMSICMPFNTIELVLSKLASQSFIGYKPKEATPVQKQQLMRNLHRSDVQLAAFLGETKIRLSELRSLRPGDILQLDKRSSRDLIVQVEGRNKYAGSPGQYRGHRAIQLTRTAPLDEPL